MNLVQQRGNPETKRESKMDTAPYEKVHRPPWNHKEHQRRPEMKGQFGIDKTLFGIVA